jgi:hypothetical protein
MATCQAWALRRPAHYLRISRHLRQRPLSCIPHVRRWTRVTPECEVTPECHDIGESKHLNATAYRCTDITEVTQNIEGPRHYPRLSAASMGQKSSSFTASVLQLRVERPSVTTATATRREQVDVWRTLAETSWLSVCFLWRLLSPGVYCTSLGCGLMHWEGVPHLVRFICRSMSRKLSSANCPIS